MWEKEEKPFSKFSNVKYLWCKSLYPTAIWDLKNFPKNFNSNTYHGISDHTVGCEISLIAIMIRNIISETTLYNNIVASDWITKYTVVSSKTNGELLPLHTDWMKDQPMHPSGPHNFDPSKLQMTLPLTLKGTDYSSGGFYFMLENKKRYFYDLDVTAGDLILWRYGIPHGVGNLIVELEQKGLTNIYFPNNFILNND